MTALRPRGTAADDGRPRPYPRPDAAEAVEAPTGMGRRGFLGWIIAAPTLVVGATALAGGLDERAAGAAVPSPPEPADLYDLSDLLTDAALPATMLVRVEVHPDGTASYAIPRAEVGQGITTSAAMIIADEMDLPLSKVTVTLSDARPELMFNQITGGSNTIHALYGPLRTAAAVARQSLVQAAATKWNVSADQLTTSDGMVHGPSGRKAGYGDLTALAASPRTASQHVVLKADSTQSLVGSAQRRKDAILAVTGKKKFAMDIKHAGALPTMVCRPPTIKGKVKSVQNMSAVKSMPGVTDVAVISTGVAVRAKTFGQCIDAVRALKVTWDAGTVDGESDATVLDKLRKAEIPLAVPKVPIGAKTIDTDYTFYFRSSSPLETGAAVADVKADSAEVWSSLKNPIVTQQTIAQMLGLPQNAVKVHVSEGGGSFGRHLFGDYAYDAVEASKAFGYKPVRLMWHRTDDFRQGRTHPMCTSRLRATVLGGQVLTLEQRHTSVATDFTHGLGEILTAFSAKLPGGNLSFAESIFLLTANVPYNFGVTTQQINEIFEYDTFPTGSMRNVYSPDVNTALELTVDKIAKAVGQDPMAFRLAFAKKQKMRDVLTRIKQAGNWGRSMPAGTAQGIAVHSEYKAEIASLVEIDCRPQTVNRKVYQGYTGPRVTKVTIVVDPGKVINTLGFEAQMQGGAMDGIANALSSSLHLKNGTFLEGSWGDYHYTRQWNVPPKVNVILAPSGGDPSGAGELAVGVTMAAVACAYARATGTMPTSFPINHKLPLDFEPYPTVPPIPQSPTDGLQHTF